MYFLFSDMHSGGKSRDNFEYGILEAESHDDAVNQFVEKLGHHPYDVTCGCCGENYWISSHNDIDSVLRTLDGREAKRL